MESDIAFCSSLMLLPEHNYWISSWLIKWSLIQISGWKTQWFNQTGNEDKNGIIRRGDRHDIIFFSPDSFWNPLSHHLKARNIWLLPKNIFDLQKIFVLTLDDDDAVGGVWAEAVGGDALVLAAVAGLAVDDLDGDDAVRVRDREQVRRQRLPGLRRYVDK